MKIVMLGLSVTSSWGNGHATTYRSLIRGLAAAGHQVLFLERDAPWYEGNRDEPNPPGATTVLYDSVSELIRTADASVRNADLVIVGSFVPDGIAIGEWVTSVAQGLTAFYDIDTPVTLLKLRQNSCPYLTRDLIRSYGLYLSFTGGPVPAMIERQYGSPAARALFCSVDTDRYVPVQRSPRWDLGYLGTWSDDRQPSLEELLLKPARAWSAGRFAVVGPQYPTTMQWPSNVHREIHLSPREHPDFYGSQRFTLNITRDAMKSAGYSPSVRLFEAGACAVPIISDWWEGLDTLLEPGREVLLAESADDTLRYLRDLSETVRLRIGAAARKRILAEHTPLRRALQLQHFVEEAARPVPTATSRIPAAMKGDRS
jgi:spore maturation protein CgeB